MKKATQFSKSGSAWSPTSAHFVENGITYDKNGNILTLKRTAGGSIVDNLAYTYTGNQLTGLTEQVSTSASNDIFVRGTNALGNYTYDTNGNMITDNRKNLQFEYNLLNLPTNVKSGEAIKARYVYTADGNKIQVRDGDGTNGYDYVGSFVYKKNNLVTKLEVINFSNGVITKVGDSYEVNYFMRDHLGSVRAIVDGTGTLKEQSDYYAFGARQKRSDYLVSENRYRYNGKEVQTTGDLGYLDYGARMYDAGIGRWFGVDPASQFASPYNFCGNNPIRFIDLDGRFAGDFFDDRGRYLGNDGIDDQKIYVMKTSEKEFINGQDKIPGAGITKKKIKETMSFIKTNSGNKTAFSSNSIAYDNSVAIESSQANRQVMVDEVSKDNGKGGTSDANNREYGGSLSDGVVKIAKPGAVTNLKTGDGASIMLPSNKTTFHSHPSGSVSTNTAAYFFSQPPSKPDINNGSTKIEYVFGRGNNTVYLYNSGGVQATIPMQKFVLMKR